MRLFNNRVFNLPEAGGGSGAAPAAPVVAAPATPPAGAGDPPSPSAVAPPAVVADPAAGGSFYKPEGLPEHLVGKDQNETMDKVFGALKGYRERDAQAGVPENVEAYGAFAADLPDTIKPHMETLKGDPLFARLNEKALALRVPVSAYQGLVQEFISVSGEMGMLEPVIDAQAERAALVPAAAAHLPPADQQQAVEKRMNENFAFIDTLVTQGADKGGLSKEDAEFAKAMLGDSARGHRVFEWMRATAGASGGSGTGPALQSASGQQDHRAELARRAALPENSWGNPKFDQRSYDQLAADRRKFHGE